jgi:transcription elongation GreA/GreB family factor
MNKPDLLRALCESLEGEIARATDTAERTRAGAIHEEAKPENDKDTRALETSYLARGQAQRVVDLQEALRLVKFMVVRDFRAEDAIDISALVELEADAQTRWYWLAAAGGGRTLTVEGVEVDVITPQAPLGRALLGRFTDEEFVLRAGGRARDFIIVAVR